MSGGHKPRSGSIAYYPRKRARRQKPHFTSFKDRKTLKSPNSKNLAEFKEPTSTEVKPLNFLGYKAGMTQVSGTNSRKNSVTFGQVVILPVTVIEVPPVKVFGIRGYRKDESAYGLETAWEQWSPHVDKHLLKKIKGYQTFMQTSKKEKESVPEMTGIQEIRLLAYTQPSLTSLGKKKPEIVEVVLSGNNVNAQLKYGQEKLGKEIKVGEVFKEQEYIDAKAVTIGHGMQGVVKRYGVKTHRPKAKYTRMIGSISPWNPSTVMWTVPRAGQVGYHTRTEYNKQVLRISNEGNAVNPKQGFQNYGLVKNDYLIVTGSIPGPCKRAIALRNAVRILRAPKAQLEGVDWIAK